MRKIILLMGLISAFSLQATTTSAVFKKYPNTYFVETGAHEGDGIQKALTAGFREVYSIELSPYYYERASRRFQSFDNVHVIYGDSSHVLRQLLTQVDAPATFWLDGHYSCGKTARGEQNTPLLRELAAIREHPIKTHTILIDDIRCCGTSDFDFITMEEIIQAILSINPEYMISFEDGYVSRDVLVAHPR